MLKQVLIRNTSLETQAICGVFFPFQFLGYYIAAQTSTSLHTQKFELAATSQGDSMFDRVPLFLFFLSPKLEYFSPACQTANWKDP